MLDPLLLCNVYLAGCSRTFLPLAAWTLRLLAAPCSRFLFLVHILRVGASLPGNPLLPPITPLPFSHTLDPRNQISSSPSTSGYFLLFPLPPPIPYPLSHPPNTSHLIQSLTLNTLTSGLVAEGTVINQLAPLLHFIHLNCAAQKKGQHITDTPS